MAYIFSEEHKRKLSEAHKDKHPSIKTRRKMSNAHKGTHHTIETRKKIGKVHKGKIVSKETRRRISKARKGKGYNNYRFGSHISEETKKKMSKSLKGRKSWNEGKHISEKTKKKISEAQKGEKSHMYGKHHTIETRRKISKSHILKSLTGAKNGRWLGGISFDPYTPDFNGNFKRKIRERDNYCCMICGKSQKELKKQLAIHHIDYNKLNSFPQNCVSLCFSCHSKTNINRTQWTAFFQTLLKEKYGYQYTQDQKIILNFMGE